LIAKLLPIRRNVIKRFAEWTMRYRFEPDELVEAAMKQTGLDRFHSSSFREGLEILTADMSRLERSEGAYETVRGIMLSYLGMRLRVDNWVETHPQVTHGKIERPLLVFGLPRTGTTLTSNLLAVDPARRSLMTWEANDPVPPPEAGHLYDDPRALAQLSAEAAAKAVNPEAFKYYRSSAVYPTEDVFPMGHDFKSLFWESHGKLPNYGEWLLNQADMRSAYAYHQRFLQVLQSEAPGVWNLKMPSHSLFLRTLLEFYPDARRVWTHRDPFTAIGSLCSLISGSHVRHVGHADDEWIGQNYPRQAALHADRIMDVRDEVGEDRIIDLHYADMMRDPIETMRGLYASLGDDFTPEAEAAMRAWLADNPQGKFGKHEYKLTRFGQSEESVRPYLERYLSRYDIEREGR
jgi:hypothetical protein